MFLLLSKWMIWIYDTYRTKCIALHSLPNLCSKKWIAFIGILWSLEWFILIYGLFCIQYELILPIKQYVMSVDVLSGMCSTRPLPSGTRIRFFNNLLDKTSTDFTPSSASSPPFTISIVSSVYSPLYYISSSSGSTSVVSLFFANFFNRGIE